MPDYTDMPIQAIFDSFDTNIKNGEIDKKEAKSAKKLYGGIFNVTKGMNIDSFKAANAELLTDKDIHTTLLNKLDESGALDVYEGSSDDNKFAHLRSLIRGAATYLDFKGIKISFKELKPYLEKSDRLEQLQNAFGFLDSRDSWELTSEGHYKVTSYNSDEYFNPSSLSDIDTYLAHLLGSSKNNIYDKEKIEHVLKTNNVACSAEDIETILLALHFRVQDIKNGNIK